MGVALLEVACDHLRFLGGDLRLGNPLRSIGIGRTLHKNGVDYVDF